MNMRGIILRGFTLLNHHAYENISPLKKGWDWDSLPSFQSGAPNLGFAGHTLDRRNFLRRVYFGWIDVELFLEPIGMMVSKKVTTHP